MVIQKTYLSGVQSEGFYMEPLHAWPFERLVSQEVANKRLTVVGHEILEPFNG
jgi:hypothetical protein